MIAVVDGIEHYMNLVPATVQCDECGDQYKAGHKYMPKAERVKLATELMKQGWVIDGDHARHICPKCVA